jgi:hypothetical protein
MISEGASSEAVNPRGAGGEPLHLSALGQGECVFDIDPEVTDGAFDLCMPEEDLYCAQIARRLVDDRRLRSAKGVCTIILPPQANASDPLPDKPGILSGAYVLGVVDPARESIVVE